MMGKNSVCVSQFSGYERSLAVILLVTVLHSSS
jgi:hypothetical protein